jgi:hypothetical protein
VTTGLPPAAEACTLGRATGRLTRMIVRRRGAARGGDEMTDVVKKSITVLVIGFAAFYLLSQPENAANAIQTAFQAVIDGFQQVIKFFTALTQ